MAQLLQYKYKTVNLNVRGKGDDKHEKLTTEGAGMAEIAGVRGRRSGRVILVLVLLHVFFQDILRVILIITIITLELLVLNHIGSARTSVTLALGDSS